MDNKRKQQHRGVQLNASMVRELRKARGLTIAATSSQAGISNRTVIRAEQGDYIQLFSAKLLARTLGVELDEVMQVDQRNEVKAQEYGSASELPIALGAEISQEKKALSSTGSIHIQLGNHMSSGQIPPEEAVKLFNAVLQFLKLGFTVNFTSENSE